MSDSWKVTSLSHLASHIHHNEMRTDSTLHVIGVISNSARFQSRIRLFREWYEAMKRTPNVKVYVVEIAFGDHVHEVTEHNNPQHLQLRAKQELWYKENMINLAVRHLLPRDWKYVCWCDADIFFDDQGWALKTIHELQHFEIVQPWSTVLDLGPQGEGLRMFEGFCNVVRQRVPMQTHPSQPYKYAHTGFAWASTRKFWENTGGLMERCIVGSADHHMAWGLIGKMSHSVHGEMSDGFKRMTREWQDKAYKVCKGAVGYVKGNIQHKFHGPKRKRYYRERWSIFTEHGFDPYKDLSYDTQGLLHLDGKPEMYQEIQGYNRSRHEDSTEAD